MTKHVKILTTILIGILFAAFAYSQNLNTQNQDLEEEVIQLKQKFSSLEQRISVIEEAIKPRVMHAK